MVLFSVTKMKPLQISGFVAADQTLFVLFILSAEVGCGLSIGGRRGLSATELLRVNTVKASLLALLKYNYLPLPGPEQETRLSLFPFCFLIDLMSLFTIFVALQYCMKGKSLLSPSVVTTHIFLTST